MEPAQQSFVRRYLNWDRVADRLNRFSNINCQFSLDFLHQCSSKPPYYCHYMAWRLGTWENEGLFEFLDKLLAEGSSLPNWAHKNELLKNCEYAEYWSLLWELQVANLFTQKGASVEWTRSGPDLKVTHLNDSFYVECYTYRKSFGLEEFIFDVLRHLDPNIRISHRWCIPFSLPKNNNVEPFLKKLFRPFLDPSFLDEKRRQAEVTYPVLLPVPDGVENFHIYLESANPEKYDPTILEDQVGIPENYLDIALREAIKNKCGANKLKIHSPNLLAINFLLSAEFEMALDRQLVLHQQLPQVNCNDAIDAVMYTSCGIDVKLTSEKLHIKPNNGSHPALDILGYPPKHPLFDRQ